MSTTNNLTFTKTMSVSRFKSVNGISKINVIKNPKTEKLFFSCPDDSSISGKVANELDYSKDLSVSECVSTEDGSVFYMLHNAGDTSANVQQTL